MSDPELTQYDFILSDGDSSYGYLVGWEGSDSEPFAYVVDEQTLPGVVSSSQTEDENYGFRDLQDTWRISFTNFSGGQGQPYRDVTGGSTSKYDKSLLIDNSVEGELRLHHALRLLRDPNTTKVSDRVAVAGGCIEWDGKLAFACSTYPGAGSIARRQIGIFDPQAAETTNWTYTGHTDDSSATTVTCMTTDGDKLYAAYANGSSSSEGVYSYTRAVPPVETKLTSDSEDPALCKRITHLCYSAGVLYAATVDPTAVTGGLKLGYLSGTDGARVFTPLSASAIMTPNLSCFGMASIGTWVYAGVTGGARSWVYALQYDGGTGTKNLEQYVELPTGFIGTSMVSYLGSLYVCGYYLSNTGDVGQGAVFLAASNGIARLCTIGDDPNLVEVPQDSDNNRIVAGYGYDHYIYLLTVRDLFRWDVRAGGLNHVAEVGTFAASSGDPGSLLTIPWDADSCWTGYAATQCYLSTDTMTPDFGLTLIDGDLHFANYTDADTGIAYRTAYTDTNDLHGNDHYSDSVPSGDDSSFATGATIEIEASRFLRECLELRVVTGAAMNFKEAVVSFYGRENSDEVLWYYKNASGAKTSGGTIPGKNSAHRIYLKVGTSEATLYIDGVEKKTWDLPSSAETMRGISYGYGAPGYMPSTTYVQDWKVSLRMMRWAPGAYTPNWWSSSGVIGQSSFTVLSNSPYIPATTGSTKGLMAFSFPDPYNSDPLYPVWVAASESLEGWLESSESASRMPTVNKYVTALDVHHDAVGPGEEIEVVAYLDGDALEPKLTISEGPATISSVNLYGQSGYAVKLKVKLRSSGDTTPCFRGGSLRFNPLDNCYYIARIDLREQRRDKTGLPYPTAAALAYLKEIAEAKRVVTLLSPLESRQVRISALQFRAVNATPGGNVEPHGFALVKMKVVP